MAVGREMQYDTNWKLKKEISIPAAIGLAVQTGAVIWFMATMNADVTQVRKQVDLYQPQTEKIIRLETKMEAIQDGIAEIKTLLRAPRT